ncbi:GNAT family N-acetyltransferase [Actinomadura macrotermitis]|uniref:N-acetyltransferase domain-containing protein n=1 Tax=Actinomadura macrotermitis TaxID=2585200 RepID=A0A7K0BSD4_9ACTN|nr:GNAT family N-acetyltransferase [Actinomadura macrotermitis]MQY03584.1 hypothetical protein [Actinomadura macrotermitis]
MPDVEYARLDAPATRAILKEIRPVYAAGFPGYSLDDWETRTTRQVGYPGFETITARDGDGSLIGFVYGFPLASSSWWEGLTPAPPPGYTDEDGTRTVAVIDLVVLPAFRSRGIGRRLVDLYLSDRAQRRATLTTSPAKPDIQRMYERWGWTQVGRVPGGPLATAEYYDVYVIDLGPAEPTSSR